MYNTQGRQWKREFYSREKGKRKLRIERERRGDREKEHH